MDYIHWAQEQLHVTCFYEDDNKSSGPEKRDEFSEIAFRKKVSASRRNLGITRVGAQNLPPVIWNGVHSSISRTAYTARYLEKHTQLDISHSTHSSKSRTQFTNAK